MKTDSFDSVVEKVQRLALDANSFAYLAIDESGLLLDQGGELLSLALPQWQPGEIIIDSALFLQGYIPMQNSYEFIECYQLNDDYTIDVHLFDDDDCILVLLVDRTSEMAEEASIRQHVNEIKLRQRREGKLKKR